MFYDITNLGTKYRESVKGKLEKNYLLFSFYNTIELLGMSKFNYKNLPGNVYNEMIERSLLRSGMVSMYNILQSSNDGSSQWYAGIPTTSGITMVYNIPEYAKLVTPCGQSPNLLVGKEIPLGFNNYNHTPEMDIMRYAELFAEIDTSIKIGVKNTRMTKVFVVSDGKKADSINSIMEDVYNGKPKAVALDTTFQEMLETGSEVRKPDISLTDPRDVETLQYLSKLHDDLVRRLATLHGHKMNTSGKLAQMTRDELNESETFSHIYVCQQMEMRKRFVDDCNRIFGTNIEVEYSCAWSHFAKGEMSADEYIEDVEKEGDNDE